MFDQLTSNIDILSPKTQHMIYFWKAGESRISDCNSADTSDHQFFNWYQLTFDQLTFDQLITIINIFSKWTPHILKIIWVNESYDNQKCKFILWYFIVLNHWNKSHKNRQAAKLKSHPATEPLMRHMHLWFLEFWMLAPCQSCCWQAWWSYSVAPPWCHLWWIAWWRH